MRSLRCCSNVSSLDSLVLHSSDLALRQILTNLLANAIKYTPPSGHVRLELTERPEAVVWQVVDDGLLPSDEVGDYMTADPVTVPETAAVADLARMMCDAHIHRVIVVNQEHRPVGVVSSIDILAAVAHGHGG